jgi:hypothetical protein
VELGPNASLLVKEWADGVIFTTKPQLMNRAGEDRSLNTANCPIVGTKWISMASNQQVIHNSFSLGSAIAQFDRLIIGEGVDNLVIICGYGVK